MQDDNGYKILDSLLKTKRAKENNLSMTPDQMYEYVEPYGDDYAGLIRGFAKEYYNKELTDDFVNGVLKSFYDDGYISVKKKSKNEESQKPLMDSTSGLDDGVSDSGNQNNEVTGDPIKDSYFYGFEHNLPLQDDDNSWPWNKIDYDQERHISYNYENGDYYINGKLATEEEITGFSIEDYEQAWVNSYNEMWQGIPKTETQVVDANYGVFKEAITNAPAIRINHPAQIKYSIDGNFDVQSNTGKAYINNEIGLVNEYTRNSIPSFDIITSLGDGDYYKHFYETKTTKSVYDSKRKNFQATNPYYEDENYNISNLDNMMGDFFYSNTEFDKNFKRINEIVKILNEDKNKNFSERKYYDYTSKDAGGYKKGQGEPEHILYQGSLNEEGKELYEELVGYYKELEDNILDAELAVLMSKEQFFHSSNPGGNPFADNVVLGDPIINETFMSGIGEDSPVAKDVMTYYLSSEGDKFSPVGRFLKKESNNRGLSKTMHLSEYLSLIKNDDQLQKFYDEVELYMDDSEKMFLRTGREGWRNEAQEEEFKLFELNRKWLNSTEEERPKIEKEIQELRATMDWIGSEMFDIDGSRINKPDYEKMPESDKQRIDKFTSEYNAVYQEIAGNTDRTELLSLYHQVASEKRYLDSLKDSYKVTLDNGVSITMDELVNNISDWMIESGQKHYGDVRGMLTSVSKIPANMLYKIASYFLGEGADAANDSLKYTDRDRKRIAELFENYQEHEETLNTRLLALGRFLFLNSDPGTIDEAKRDGYFRENALGEGLAEGFMNLLPVYWENLGRERYDYESSRDVLQDMITTAEELGYELTEDQKKAAEQSILSQVVYGTGSALPLIVAISAATGPLSGYLIRSGVGAGSRGMSWARSRLGSTSTWVKNIAKVENNRAAYYVTRKAIQDSGKMGQFTFRFAEELAKGYMSFEMAGAHGEMGAGIHGGTVLFQSIFPQTKLSRKILWSDDWNTSLKPKDLTLVQRGEQVGVYDWIDDAGNIVKSFKPAIADIPKATVFAEKGMQFIANTTGGTFGMYLGEIFQHCADNGIDLEAIGRDVFGISMEGEEGRAIEKLLVTTYMSALFSGYQAVKTNSVCERALVNMSLNPKVPEQTRNEIKHYLDMFEYYKGNQSFQGNRYNNMSAKQIFENDPFASLYNIEIDRNGNVVPKENNVNNGYFTKESFKFNKDKNVFEADMPDSNVKFMIKRNSKKDGGEFYIEVGGKKQILGKNLTEATRYLNDFILQREKGIIDTQDPRAGMFEQIRSFNRESINKEQASSHKSQKISVFNDMAGNMLGKDGYMLKLFPELRVEVKPEKVEGAYDWGLQPYQMEQAIANYKNSVKEILIRNPHLDVVTYQQGGKTYIELMARTENMSNAQRLAKQYNIGNILNLKNGKDIKVEINGPDINNSKTESIYDKKSNMYDFTKSGLSGIDKNNSYFGKSIIDRVTDVADMTFIQTQRAGAIKNIDGILTNLSNSKTGLNPNTSKKFWSTLQKELKNEDNLSMVDAYNKTIEILRERGVNKKFLDQMEYIGAEKMLNSVTPYQTRIDYDPNLLRTDGMVYDLNQMFSYREAPPGKTNTKQSNLFELDANGNIVRKDKQTIYESINESLNNRFNLQKFIKYLPERVWEQFGRNFWTKDKAFKDAFKYNNRWFQGMYDKVYKENPQLAAYLKNLGNQTIMFKENSAGSSGITKIETFKMRQMFAKMTAPELRLFENIMFNRHVISMDKARDSKKVDLDKTIAQINLLLKSNAIPRPKAEMEALIEQAKVEAESLGMVLQDPSFIYSGKKAYGKYSLSTKENTLIEQSQLLENGNIDVQLHTRNIDGKLITETPWRLKHGDKGEIVQLEQALIFMEVSKELHNGKTNEGKSGNINIFDKYNNLSFDKVNAKVDKYFEHFQYIARKMYESGIIGKDAYETMISREYLPREFVDYVSTLKNGTNSGNVENIFEPLQSLKGGFDNGPLNMDAKNMVLNKNAAVNTMIWQNNVRRSIADNLIYQEKLASKYGRPNEYKDFGFMFDKTKNQTLESRAKELGIDKDLIKDYVEIEYRIDGQSKTFALHKDMHGSMIRGNFWSRFPAVQKAIELYTGSTSTRMTTTILEWSFMPVNFIRDSQNILFNRNIYSPHIPEAIRQYTGDINAVSSAAFSFNKAENPLIQKYYQRGGALDFLSLEGRRIGTEESPFLSYGWYEKMKKNNNWLYEADRVIKNTQKKTFDVLTYLGESSELLTRLAVFERQIANRTKEFEQQYKRKPNEKELIEIEQFAANDARNNIDFSQGGTITKFLDSFIPYTNASVQGFRVFSKNMIKNPKQAAYKYAQFASYVGGLQMYNWQTYPKEMEQLWNTRPYEFMNNHVFFLPYKDEAGNQMYIKLAKEHSQLGMAAMIEGYVAEAFTGTNYVTQGDYGVFVSEENKNLLQKSIQAGTPFGAGLDVLNFDMFYDIPLFKGMRGYQDNWDSFRNRRIYYKDDQDHGADLSIEYNQPGSYNATNPMFKDLATGLETITGSDISPARLQYMAEAFGIKGSIFEGLMFGYNEFFDQANSNELKYTIDEKIQMNLLDALGEKSYNKIIGSVDMDMEVSEITMDWQRQLQESEKLNNTVRELENKNIKYLTNEYLKIYKKKGKPGFKDDPRTLDVDEFEEILKEKRLQLENYFLSRYKEVDGISIEQLTKNMNRIIENCQEEAMLISSGVTYDIRDIKDIKKFDPEQAAEKFYALMNSVDPLRQEELMRQATICNLFTGKRGSKTFEKTFYSLNEYGWEAYRKDLTEQERYVLDVQAAILKDRKYEEMWLQGLVSVQGGISLNKVQLIAPWHELAKESMDENGNIDKERLMEIAKQYIELEFGNE